MATASKAHRDSYNRLADKQQYRCAICGRFEWDCPKKKLCIDHNHSTGEIRSLLCTKCNCALGMLDESPIKTQQLLNYIQAYC